MIGRYNISALGVSRSGMIYIQGVGHIYPNQAGIRLEAMNIQSTGEGLICDGIHIKVMSEDGECRGEVVWPNIAPLSSVYKMAAGLSDLIAA